MCVYEEMIFVAKITSAHSGHFWSKDDYEKSFDILKLEILKWFIVESGGFI